MASRRVEASDFVREDVQEGVDDDGDIAGFRIDDLDTTADLFPQDRLRLRLREGERLAGHQPAIALSHRVENPSFGAGADVEEDEAFRLFDDDGTIHVRFWVIHDYLLN